MGLDTHMLAGSRACSTSTLAHSLTITNQTNQHFAETLPQCRRSCAAARAGSPGSADAKPG